MVSNKVAAFPSAVDSGVMVGYPPPPSMRVTLENWQKSPWNRWAFLHTREVIPTANVSRRETPTWQLAREPMDLAGLSFDMPEGGARTLGEFLEHSWTDGFIVIHRGKLLFEAYRNGMKSDSRHIAMSVSKSITSLVTGILVGRGLIDPRSPVTAYVPELAGTGFEGATVQHLLDMEVATAWREDYFSQATEFWRLDVACGWLPPREGAAPTLYDFIRQSRLDGKHGERVQYSSLNPDLLGLLAERVTGARFTDVVSDSLWAPAGMEFDADLALDPAGTAVADGGYCVALRDLARIGQLVLCGGSGNGRQVVAESWLNECRRPNPKPFDPTSYGSDWPGASYHNQWWQMDGRLFALGIHGQMIAVDHEAQLVVVFVASPPEPNDAKQRLTQRHIVQALADRLR